MSGNCTILQSRVGTPPHPYWMSIKCIEVQCHKGTRTIGRPTYVRPYKRATKIGATNIRATIHKSYCDIRATAANTIYKHVATVVKWKKMLYLHTDKLGKPSKLEWRTVKLLSRWSVHLAKGCIMMHWDMQDKVLKSPLEFCLFPIAEW